MDQLVENLKIMLAASDPKQFRVVSFTDPGGNTITYSSYSDLMEAYLKARAIVRDETPNNYRPIRLGRGNRR